MDLFNLSQLTDRFSLIGAARAAASRFYVEFPFCWSIWLKNGQMQEVIYQVTSLEKPCRHKMNIRL